MDIQYLYLILLGGIYAILNYDVVNRHIRIFTIIRYLVIIIGIYAIVFDDIMIIFSYLSASKIFSIISLIIGAFNYIIDIDLDKDYYKNLSQHLTCFFICTIYIHTNYIKY